MTGTYDLATGFKGWGTNTLTGEIYDSDCKRIPISETLTGYTWTGQLTPSNGQCTITGIFNTPTSEKDEFRLIVK